MKKYDILLFGLKICGKLHYIPKLSIPFEILDRLRLRPNSKVLKIWLIGWLKSNTGRGNTRRPVDDSDEWLRCRNCQWSSILKTGYWSTKIDCNNRCPRLWKKSSVQMNSWRRICYYFPDKKPLDKRATFENNEIIIKRILILTF